MGLSAVSLTLHPAQVSFCHNKRYCKGNSLPTQQKQTLEVNEMLTQVYLNILSVQHAAVHAVDSRGEEAGRRQAAQCNGYDVTSLHPQH